MEANDIKYTIDERDDIIIAVRIAETNPSGFRSADQIVYKVEAVNPEVPFKYKVRFTNGRHVFDTLTEARNHLTGLKTKQYEYIAESLKHNADRLLKAAIAATKESEVL